jgi:hypothetical protein
MTTTAYTATDLWHHVYGEPPADTRLFMCAFAARRATPDTMELDLERQAFYTWPAEAEKAAAWLAAQAADGCETYQAAHLVTRWRRQKEDTADVLTLWCDVDAGTIAEHCQPTALVESSPGRSQAYLRLTRHIPWQRAENLNRRLAQLYGGDNGWHATKLLRTPNTPNNKYESRPTVRVLYIRAVAYDPDELDRILPPLKTNPTAEQPGDDLEDEPPVRLEGDDLRAWRGEIISRKEDDGTTDRSDSLWLIGCILEEHGMTASGIAAALQNRDEHLGWNCYTSRPKYYRITALKIMNRERRKSEPKAVFGSTKEPSPCSDQVAALQARIDQLEAALAERDAALAEANERFRRSLALDRNAAIKAQRTVVKAVAWELQSAYVAGRADPDGWVKTWLGGLAENAGTSADRASVHTTTMARDGLVEKAVRKEPVEKVDPETGEVTTVVLPRVYLRCTSVTELLEKAASWTPSPSPKKPRQSAWGGFREANPDTCPHEHTQITCLDCGATLDREPQDAGHEHDHTPADAPVAAGTLHPQDAGHDRRRDVPDGYSECVNCHALTKAGESLCWSCDFRINGNVRTAGKAPL